MTRCGFVAVAGLPNAGKSTFLNQVVGLRLAITSPRPQSTRQRVVGIHSSAAAQIVFVDTPGLLDPRYHLQRAMAAEIHSALVDADAVIHLIDATRDITEQLQIFDAARTPGLTRVRQVVNKSDTLSPSQIDELRTHLPDANFISAASGQGVAELLVSIEALLPEAPFLYPADDLSSQNMRFFVSEALREAAFEQLEDELPYAVHVEIDEFRESSNPVYIRATAYVERDSQKGILIGAGGSRIREIGRAAREKAEALVGSAVYLDLRVKVLPNWRRNVDTLRRLGFTVPSE